MKNLELAKYWYYRLKKQWDANNRNDTIQNRLKLLESYLIKYDYIELGAELSQKDYLILLLHAAKYYGKDYRLYFTSLKTNLYKYLWDTRPDGLRYNEYLIKYTHEKGDQKVISNALKRLHPYSETSRYEQIITPFTEEDDNNDGQIFVENGKTYKIRFKKSEYLVPIFLVPDENILANSYITYSKYPDSIEIIELKKLFKKLEPAEKEISQLILDILIDQKISIKSVEYNELKKKLEEITTETKIIRDLHTEITRLANDNHDTNRQLELAIKTIKKQKEQLTTKKTIYRMPTKEEMEILIDENRFKESEIVNCTAIGRILKRDPDTIKRWIITLNLKLYAFPKR